ncbi:MAG: DUF4159 domain-containing protein [Saprospiraceae bacterium]|nr:DUF4159 domain-containing protein [Saprospiraceae bacterium]
MALLKYNGGGDWYSVVDALENLVKFTNQNLNTGFSVDYATVDVGSAEVFNYPLLFLTGHGNIILSDQEAENLRNYMLAGGFLFIDDDFGIDPFIRPVLKKIFPQSDLKEVPFNHPIYHQKYDFPRGLPKVHKHNDKPTQGFGIFNQGRMVCFYSFESNISDGWESPEVHKDEPAIRQAALKMGANIIQFAFTQ